VVRFALVHAGAEGAALARLEPRIPEASVTAIVEPDAKVAAELARTLGAKVSAVSAEELHQQHDDTFDTWLARTPGGWLIVPHADRPMKLQFEAWTNHPPGWMWGQPFRFLPSVLAVKASLTSGQLGEPGLVRIHHWQSPAAGDARHAMLPQLDLACWLVGLPPTVLFAQSRQSDTSETRALDYLQVHLGFAEDRMAIIDCSTSLTGGNPYSSLSVIGSSGAAYADDHRNMQLQFGGEKVQAIPTTQGDLALLAILHEYLAAKSESRLPACGEANWKRASKLLTAAEESLRIGQSVSIDQQER
jgi:predicted dehydrogenase